MKIVDPKTMKKHKLFSRKGLKIFEDYLNYFKKNERRIRIKALKMDMKKINLNTEDIKFGVCEHKTIFKKTNLYKNKDKLNEKGPLFLHLKSISKKNIENFDDYFIN